MKKFEFILYGEFFDKKNENDEETKNYKKKIPYKNNFIFRLDWSDTKNSNDNPFAYHKTIIDILLDTLKGDIFSTTIKKLKNFFPLEFLLDILLQEDNFIINKPSKEKGLKVLLKKVAKNE